MKKILIIGFFSILGTISFGQVNSSSTYVNGYTKSNGTYVQGHYKTTPNNTINDNYSTKPNVNPYTGKQGTASPSYNQPQSTYKSSSSGSKPTYTFPKNY